MLEIYVDGSCKGNGSSSNDGGFGVVVTENNKIIHTYSQKEQNTTNNRMELKAILYAIHNYGSKDVDNIPIVYSDSAYSINTLTNWMFNWANNNWTKSDNKTPENLELIQEYYDLFLAGYRINLQKVKGHAGIKFNELADKLAKGEV